MFTLQLHGGGAAFQEWQLNPGRYRIGRAAEADIQLADSAVSSFHCELEITSDGVIVRDLGSSNGTFVNRQPIREARLQPGQSLQLGSSVMTLQSLPQTAGPAAPVGVGFLEGRIQSPPRSPIGFPADSKPLKYPDESARKRPGKWTRLAAAGTVILVVVVVAVSIALSSNRVKSVRVQTIELFYTRPVTEVQAKRVAEFLADMWGKDKAVKRLLARSGGTYHLLLAFTKADSSHISEPILEHLAFQVSDRALKHAPVEVHLCDEKMLTVKVVKPLPEREKLYASVLRGRTAMVRLQQGKTDEAISELRQAAELFPENLQGWIILGDVYLLNAHQCREAMMAYEKVLRMRPQLKNAHLFNNLASAYSCLNTNLAVAVQLAKRAVELQPDVWAYLQTSASIAIQSGQYKETLEALEKAFKKEPFAGLWRYVGQIAQSKIAPELFLGFCERIKTFAPPLELKLALSDFHRAHGDAASAEKAAEEARQEHARLGFPPENAWLVIGPFDNPNGNGLETVYGPEQQFVPRGEYPGKAGLVRWQANDATRPDGRVDFGKLLNPKSDAVAYAAIDVLSTEEKAGQLRIGSDDRVKVWLNGRAVWTSPEDRPLRMDQDVVPLKLLRGKNQLLFKVSQGSGEWELLIRITDSLGQPMPGLEYHTPAPENTEPEKARAPEARSGDSSDNAQTISETQESPEYQAPSSKKANLIRSESSKQNHKSPAPDRTRS